MKKKYVIFLIGIFILGIVFYMGYKIFILKKGLSKTNNIELYPNHIKIKQNKVNGWLFNGDLSSPR